MAKRFAIPAIPKGEAAAYTKNPFESSILHGYVGTNLNSEMIVRPNDELLIQKGGAEAFNIYNRLIFDETVQSALMKSQHVRGSLSLQVTSLETSQFVTGSRRSWANYRSTRSTAACLRPTS